jgi:tetratricopeptide (TPR) repeat protein
MTEAKLAARSRRARDNATPADTAPDTPDAIEIALQAVAANADGHPLARAVLERHARLLDVQCQREREEWSVLRMQRWTRWLILSAIIGLLAGIAALLWTASRSNSLVIEPFEVPPSLAQRGITGKVVAARVLDRLADLQRKTESMRGAGTYANDWQDDIKLDIPQTGIAVGEAWRTLKGWLGTQTRIGGEVTVEPDGALAITTRAGPDSGGTVTAPPAEFERLTGDAALGLFRLTQPYRYAISREDSHEAIAALTALTASDQPMERKWAYSGLSARYRGIGDAATAVEMAKRALALDPELLPAIGNLGHAYAAQGKGQAAVDTHRRMREIGRRRMNDAEYDQRISRLNILNSSAYTAAIVRDPQAMAALEREFDAIGGGTTFDGQTRFIQVEEAVLRHDLARAATLPRPGTDTPRDTAIDRARFAVLLAAERGDAAAARRGAADFLAAVRVPAELGYQSADWPVEAAVAMALVRVGAADAAAAILQRLPADCYECDRARGWASLANGDRARARAWFEKAVRDGPRLAAARVDLGRLEALEGSGAAALAQLREAARLAPNWADPHRYLGDVLGRAGDLAGARDAYARAAKSAPRWGALRLNQGRVLLALGERAEAALAFAEAGRAILRPADRARLASARTARQ